MKKVLNFIAAFMLLVSTSTSATSATIINESELLEVVNEDELLKQTCFEWANNWVIMMEGDINLSNIGWVVELTNICESW